MLNSLKSRSAGRAALAAAASFGLIVALAACSAGPSAEEELDNTSAEAAYEDWALDFDACMKAEGVEMLSAMPMESSESEGGAVTLDSGSIDMEAFEAANKKCVAELGEPPVQPGMPSDDEMNEMMLVFAKCMREAGYDYPDPEPIDGSGGAVSVQAFSADDIDPADMDACSAKAGFTGVGESE